MHGHFSTKTLSGRHPPPPPPHTCICTGPHLFFFLTQDIYETILGKCALKARIKFVLIYLKKLSVTCLPFIWRIIRRYTRSGFDDICSTNELSRETEKISRGRVRYLELTEFQLIPRDQLQKKAVFKLLT